MALQTKVARTGGAGTPAPWCLQWQTDSMPAPAFWYYSCESLAKAAEEQMIRDHRRSAHVVVELAQAVEDRRIVTAIQVELATDEAWRHAQGEYDAAERDSALLERIIQIVTGEPCA